MLIGVNPAETVWRSWPEIQRERIRLDQRAAEDKRKEAQSRIAALKDISAETRQAALKPFDDLLARLAAEEADLKDDPGQTPGADPEFQIGHLSWKIRGKVRALHATGRIEDIMAGIELLVRHGCRGHRGLQDGSGASMPFAFSESHGNFPVLDEATFELYAASGLAEPLAAVILDHNTLGQDRRKN